MLKRLYYGNKKISFYKLDVIVWDLEFSFTLKDCLFGGIKLAKNADPGKCIYSGGYHVGFSLRSEFLLIDGSVGKNVIIFWVNISSSVHIDNRKEDVFWILSKGPTQGLDDTRLTAEAQYSINFSRSNIKFCLSLSCNGSNIFLFVNATRRYQFKAKDFEIRIYPLCLGNISGGFSVNNMKKNSD